MKRALFVPAAAAVAAASAVLLSPIHANGVTGNAVRPHYEDYGWFAYAPTPEHPTTDDLRAGGVRVPQDVVAARRHLAAGIAAAGIVVTGAGVGVRRRRGKLKGGR